MYTKKPFELEELPDDDPKDRRTIKRRHLIYYLRVWDSDSGEMIGHVVDITTEGMMLIGEKKLPLHKTFQLEIRWREPSGGPNLVIAFRAASLKVHRGAELFAAWSRPKRQCRAHVGPLTSTPR